MSESTLMNATLTRRRALQLLGIGAAGAALAACAPTGVGTSPTTPTAAAGGSFTPTDFDFASWALTEEASAPAIKALLAGYSDAQHITIGEVSFPYNEYFNQIMLQIRGGQFMGAAQVDVAWLGSLAALGTLQDVSAVTKNRGYTQAALEAAQFHGVQYAFPWTIGAIGLLANSEILDKADIPSDDFPVTIDDYETALKRLKGLGGGLIPYAASTKAAQLKDVLIWMETFGSPLVEDGEVTIGDEASVAAVAWYKSLYDQGLIAADVDRFDARSLFSQGRAAIYDDAPVGRNAVTKDSPDPKLASKLVPVSRPVLEVGDAPRALVWGNAIAIASGEGAETAADFARWATSDLTAVLADHEVRGLPPVTEKALSSEEVLGDAFGATFSERITATATTNPFWQYTQYAQIESTIAEKVQSVLIGQQSPKDAMTEAGRIAQTLIG
ncbi:MAG TPA: ABC transporter substrate-binding protein [Microbacterium sp.]|uniref:ABC transporter substrate-binding protein n=1 Tax=Microbacterium sp. TaxID=51671 RepID=UPI002F950907